MNRKQTSLMPILNRWSDIRSKQLILECLDRIAATSSIDIAARTLSAIADVLYSFPNMNNYLRYI